MDSLATAYRTLSDATTKKEYDLRLADTVEERPLSSGKLAQGYLDKALECIAEKNVSGCILWLHRAIEYEPNCSSHREMLGRCLSTIPEYRREAVEEFELAIELDPRNISAHIHYGEMLEQLKAPWKARFHYSRVLEINPHHWEARERLSRLGAGTPRSSSKTSLLGRLTGRR
jgi:tetratricopeptide (TPR) repeat protein